jgi:hypothetical protein
MTFKLVKKSTGPALSVFHVVNSAGAIVGSINVRSDEEKDLLRYWRADAPPGRKARAVKAVRLPAMSKQAILRGC